MKNEFWPLNIRPEKRETEIEDIYTRLRLKNVELMMKKQNQKIRNLNVKPIYIYDRKTLNIKIKNQKLEYAYSRLLRCNKHLGLLKYLQDIRPNPSSRAFLRHLRPNCKSPCPTDKASRRPYLKSIYSIRVLFYVF